MGYRNKADWFRAQFENALLSDQVLEEANHHLRILKREGRE